MLIGYASFYHLIYSNIEYKNHIRALEYISRDLNLNKGISEYRKGNKDISRSTYMALPLLLKIRKRMPFTMLTAFTTGICGASAIFLFLPFIIRQCFKDICVNFFNVLMFDTFISIVVFLLISCRMRTYWIKTENEAEAELDKRDPMRETANQSNSSDAKNRAAD